MIRIWLAGAVLAAVLGGCGPGAGDIDAVAPLVGGPAGKQAVQGRALFVQNCASCHTLADAGAHGTVGPDLDDRRPDGLRAARKVQVGGGGMPAFTGRLSRAEILRLAAYVDALAGE